MTDKCPLRLVEEDHEERLRLELEEMARLERIRQVRLERSLKFYKVFLTCFMVVMVVFLAAIVFSINNAVFDWGFESVVEVLNCALRVVAMSSGFIMAEFIRRSTVDEETEDLRCLTWKKIWMRLNNNV